MGWKQKTVEILKVEGEITEIKDWDASVAFTSAAIEFPESVPWALIIGDYAITAGAPTITVEASAVGDGTDWVQYKAGSTDFPIVPLDNRCLLDDDFSPHYFRVVYTPDGGVGTFTMRLSK